jgi:cell division protein FtsB
MLLANGAQDGAISAVGQGNGMSIQQKSASQSHEAVVFFAGGEVGKEMLYPEFEALLDCVVPIRDFAGSVVEAAYVRVDDALAPVAVVLFFVPFDEDGFPDQRWNVPLRQLAERGARGPDLGGGPVRLVTRSQCPLAGQEDNLWEVSFNAGGNTLSQLQECLRINRLGIDAAEAPGPAQAVWSTAPQQPQAMPGAPQVAAGESPDALMAFMQQSQQQLAASQQRHQQEMQALQQRLAALQAEISTLQNEKGVLLQRVAEQNQVFERERSAMEHAGAEATASMRRELERVRQQFETERDAAIAQRDQRLREELQRLERERQVEEEHLAGLRTELTELRRDRLRLVNEGADKFFDALKEKGVKFVAFQPGAGHLTITTEDLARYLQDTETFVAEKCKVSPEHYRRWLAHYNSPQCQGSGGHGGPCGKPLTKVLKPADFVAGMSDRCEIHQQLPRTSAVSGKSA